MTNPAIKIHLILTPGADTLGITARFSGLTGLAGQPFLQVPRLIASVPGQKYDTQDVAARDQDGPLPLTAGTSESPENGTFFPARTFTPSRDTTGDITVTYCADIVPADSPRQPGPSFDLRGTDGGFAGAFASFLLLPTDPETRVHLTLTWNFPDGDARGFTTRGPGDITADMSLPEAMMTFLIAGRVHTLPPDPGTAHFNAYWIGCPPFVVQEAMEWCSRAHQILVRLFREPDPAPYHFMLRPHPNHRDGGAATHDGFMLEYGTGPHTEAARRYMFLHEMIHHFVGTLDGPPGAVSWYSEGLAEYYKIKITAMAGLLDSDAHRTEIQTMTRAYYRNPYVNLPFSEVPDLYWADSHAQGVAYNRGFMYFTGLDVLIRERSGGDRSLHDVVLGMIENRRSGRPCDEAAWRAAVHAEVGEAGVEHFEDMLAGKTMVPPSDAFGPDLTRVRSTATVRRLGFYDRSLTTRPHVIAGLDLRSSAAAAGLRDGDTVNAFRGAEPAILHSTEAFALGQSIHLDLTCDGRPSRIEFVPDEVVVDEYSWVPV